MASTSSQNESKQAIDRETDHEVAGEFMPLINSKAKKCFSLCDYVCLFLLVICVIAILGLPSLFHFLPLKLDLKNTSCELFPWATSNSNHCTATSYDGNVCVKELHTLQKCLHVSDLDTIWINNTSNSHDIEKLSLLVDIIKEMARPECSAVVVPFICQYSLSLCYENQLFTPSKENCFKIKDFDCSIDELLVENHLSQFDYLLPNCSTLPGNASIIVKKNLTCPDMFIKTEKGCRPECGKFEQFSKSVLDMPTQTSVLVAAIIGILSTVLVIFFVILSHRDKMRSCFPSTYLIYASLGHLIADVFLVVSASTNGRLYCTDDKNLLKSIVDPSTFCTLSGAIFHYLLVSILLWTVIHSCFICFKAVCPIASKKIESFNIIHITVSVAGWLAPLPAVLVGIFDKHSIYVLSYFNPPMCFTRSQNLWYYSTVLVTQLMTAIEVCVLGVTFRVLHKYQGILKSNSNHHHHKISSAEKKLLFTFCYYVVVGIFILIHSNLCVNKWNELSVAYNEYFYCQSKGIDPMQPHKCDYLLINIHSHSFPVLAMITSLMIGATPIVNLLFVANFKAIFTKLSSMTCVSRTDNDDNLNYFS